MDGLIIMDGVSGVADVSKKFANVLTVSRKCGYNCVYVFHIIVLASQICKKLFLKLIYFTFFLQAFHIIQLLKFFKVIAFYKVRNMFLHFRFG